MSEVVNETTGEIAEATIRTLCTLDVSTIEGKKQVINARNTAKSLNSIGDKPLQVVGAYITEGQRTRTFPPKPCANVYLFTKDGNAYFSQSEGIARSVYDIVDMFPDFAHNEGGLKLRVASTPLPNGNTLKALELM